MQKNQDYPEPPLVDAATDARNVDALFVSGSFGWKTGRMATRTVISYRHYWTVFVDWCESSGLSPVPAEPTTVLEFIKTRFDLTTPGGAIRKRTAYNMLAAINHANMQLTRMRASYRSAIAYLKTIEDPPVDLPIANRLDLDRFLDSLPDTLQTLRLKCVLLLIYEELLRVPEIVALTLDGYARSEDTEVSALFYRSAWSKGFEWHPIAERSAAAIEEWIAAARITAGPLFRRVRRGGAVATTAVTKEGLEHTIALAQTKWRGPRISARSLHRGRAADALHPDARGEWRDEQRWRVGRGQLQYLHCSWKLSAKERWLKDRKRAKRGG